jgi:hypothetical protein
MASQFRQWLQRAKKLSESSARNYTGYLNHFLKVCVFMFVLVGVYLHVCLRVLVRV